MIPPFRLLEKNNDPLPMIPGQAFIARREREDDGLRDGRRLVDRRRDVASHRPRRHRPVRLQLRQEVAGEGQLADIFFSSTPRTFAHLLRTYFYVCHTDGTARIYPTCHAMTGNRTHVIYVAPLRDLKSMMLYQLSYCGGGDNLLT